MTRSSLAYFTLLALVLAGWGERGEVVDCGPGRDIAVRGPGDRYIDCETIR